MHVNIAIDKISHILTENNVYQLIKLDIFFNIT